MERPASTLPGRPTSPWVDTAPPTAYPPAGSATTVDCFVIGAGICGLTAALALKEAGANVAVVEANRVGMGVTGYTTAKLSSLQALIYAKLRSKHSTEAAQAYAAANRAGLELVAGWVRERAIDCDFRRKPAFTYTEEARHVSAVEQEVEAAIAAGLDARLVHETDLPWPVQAAVRLDDQAEFHPRLYLIALAAAVDGDGSAVYERTRALQVHEGEPCRVETDRGEVRAGQVIVASHYPFLDRGLFFARLSAMRSYALGVRVDGPVSEGMYISADSPTRSVRATPDRAAGGGAELLIVGGEGHKTGQDGDTASRYEALQLFAHDRFAVREIPYRWSAQDCVPVDDLPYVGAVRPGTRRVWMASGFNKWGMTNGAAAGRILADLVRGEENPWAEVFDAQRATAASVPQLLKENANVGLHFFADRLAGSDVGTPEDLAPGTGGLARHDGELVGAFRDDDGLLHLVDPTCTHLYCRLRFNPAERSWDCPCHGSRFDVDGRVLEGPAVHDLDVRSVARS
jgi:glycine/D-amino acid oxidase-like deaminating enzyme/nitrite reductase/ring-hydroxylating ferredoxin subunit